MDTFRTMKANLKLQGTPCPWCGQPLDLGQDASVCNECGTAHHEACRQSRGGCGGAGCINAPLQPLPSPAPGPPPPGGGAAPGPLIPPGGIQCPSCKAVLSAPYPLCPFCKRPTSPDGVYHGPTETAPGANAALVLGLVGLVICGWVLGIIAIVKANEAKRAIKSNPRYVGDGQATAGLVLGVLDIVACTIYIILSIANRMH